MYTSLLYQAEEIQAIDKLVTRVTDAGTLGIAAGLIVILLLGVLAILLQQRNFGKQTAAAAGVNEKQTDLFSKLLGSISDRLQDAQDTKIVLNTVIDNQGTILTNQTDQGKLLMALPELIGLVNEALTLLRQTVNQAKETALATGQQTTEGFNVVGQRFDRVDMANGEMLKEIKALRVTIQAWLDRQEIGTLSQVKEQRSNNAEVLAALGRIEKAIVHGTQENPVVKSEPNEGKQEE